MDTQTNKCSTNRYYNLYNNSVRINKDPITDTTLDTIKKQGYISKVQPNGSVMTIPLSRLQIIECIIL